MTHGGLPIAEGALWLDVTTLSPNDTDGFARWAREHSVAYVHTPVIGSLAPARARAPGPSDWATPQTSPSSPSPMPGDARVG